MTGKRTTIPLSVSHPELCKQWHPTKNGDLTPDSFISASSRPEFDHRLLVSTGQLSKNAEYKLTHQEKSTAFLLHHHLSDSIVDWLAYLDESRTALPDKKNPRPHQQKAIDDVIEGFATNDRGRLIMACGTGKTLVGVWVAERLKSARTLVLVPSLSLVNQISREWQANSTEPFRALFVCSDPTVAKDAFVSSTSELKGRVTTDPVDIHRFLSGTGNRVVFSTYQSSREIAAAQTSGAPAFDLVIADEAHHCAGKVDSAFATVLDSDSLKASRRLFMTATPRYLSRRVKDVADQSDIRVSSMDDPLVFGPELHILTFGQAIDQDLLSDYQVLILGVTDAEVKRLVDDRALVELLGEGSTRDAESLAALVGTLKAIKNYDLNHVVTFHNRVKRAKDFSSTLLEVNGLLPDEYAVTDLWTQHVSGNTPTAVRTTTLQKFRQKSEGVSLLSNARCLGEGVDVREIDGVGFIDPRKSNIDIVQAVGRAIRKRDDSKIGTIVLPVLIDAIADNDVDEQLNSSRFSAIWDVLNALRAHDEVLAEQIDQLRFQIGRHGRTIDALTGKIVIDVPTEVGIEFHQALETRIINTTTSSWEFWFGLMTLYAEQKGRARIPKDYVENGFRLGGWAHNQRVEFGKGKLMPERVSKLDSLPGWTWNIPDTAWEEMFAALNEYGMREGHLTFPNRYREGDLGLGAWANHQRTMRLRDTLSAERTNRLEQVPGWVWNPTEAAWNNGFRFALQYVEREGHASIPANHQEDAFRLGQWIISQRSRKSKSSAEQISKLESLPGWSWNTLVTAWDTGFNHLTRYVEREGNARVPHIHTEDGYALGQWVVNQRMTRHRLSEDRKARLENLPGWAWVPRDEYWEEGFAALQVYVDREGNAQVPTEHMEGGYPLGAWVSKQRGDKGSSATRKSRLESLPGWAWNAMEARWEKAFVLLNQYVTREGNARVPASHVEDGLKLGNWLGTQRNNRGKLSEDRQARLEGLPGWTWNLNEADWEKGFAALQKYFAREGHTRVSQKHIEAGFKLGQWVSNQRSQRSTLSAEQIKRLETVLWVWNGRDALWEDCFEALKRYVAREGHCRVPYDHREDDIGLGSWVRYQKRDDRSNSPERMAKLEGLPGWEWNTNKQVTK